MTKRIAILIKDDLIESWLVCEWSDGLGFGCSNIEELKEHFCDDEQIEIIEALDEIINE